MVCLGLVGSDETAELWRSPSIEHFYIIKENRTDYHRLQYNFTSFAADIFV